MSYAGPETISSEWDANFTQVLSRTRENISRISSRYDGQPDQSSHRMYGRSVAGTPMPPTPASPSHYQQSSSPYSQLKSGMKTQHQHTHVAPPSNTIAVDADVLNQILDRLDKLEGSRSLPGNAEHRLASMEGAVDAMRRKLEATGTEVQDTQRASMQLGNQITRQSGLLEVLQQDVDARRSVVSRMDSWARQGEIWRDDMDGQVAALNRQLKDLGRTAKENRDSLGGAPSHADLEQLRDRLTVSTQQTVAASLSVWHDKVESSVRQVERQVAALRIGRTIGSGSTGEGDAGASMSNAEVQEALSTQQPSELLVKSMVDSAVRATEQAMEASIEARIRAEMKSEQVDTARSLEAKVKEGLARLAAEAGLTEGDSVDGGASGGTARSAVSSRRAQERELEGIANKLADANAAIIMMQENADAGDKHHTTEMRAVERRLDEVVAVSTSSVTSVQARCSGLEELVRNSELAQRSAMASAREETLERVRETASSMSSDRASLDRRLLMVEKTCEDLVERLKMSSSAIEAFFTSSAEGRRLQASAARTEMLQVELQNLKTDARETANALARLDAQSARKTEYAELRDRVAHTEASGDIVKRLEAKVAKEGDDQSRFTGQLISLEQGVAVASNANRALADRVGVVEKREAEARAGLVADKEAGSLLGLRVSKLDEALREEVGRLQKEGSKAVGACNSLESKLRGLESQVAAVGDANQALSKSHTASGAHVDTRLDSLSQRVTQLAEGALLVSPSSGGTPPKNSSKKPVLSANPSSTSSASKPEKADKSDKSMDNGSKGASGIEIEADAAEKMKGKEKERAGKDIAKAAEAAAAVALKEKEREKEKQRVADEEEEEAERAALAAKRKQVEEKVALQKKHAQEEEQAALKIKEEEKASLAAKRKQIQEKVAAAKAKKEKDELEEDEREQKAHAKHVAAMKESLKEKEKEKESKEKESKEKEKAASLESAVDEFDFDDDDDLFQKASAVAAKTPSKASPSTASKSQTQTPQADVSSPSSSASTPFGDLKDGTPSPVPSSAASKASKPKVKVPSLGLNLGATIATKELSKDKDDLSPPPSKRKEEQTETDAGVAVSTAAAKPTPVKPNKPSKPEKTVKPAAAASTAAGGASVATSSTPGKSTTTPAKPEKALTARERLLARTQASKASKSAVKSPKAAQASPAAGKGEDLVQSFEDLDSSVDK